MVGALRVCAAQVAVPPDCADRDFVQDEQYLQWLRLDVTPDEPMCLGKVDAIDDQGRVRCVEPDGFRCGRLAGDTGIKMFHSNPGISCVNIMFPDRRSGTAPDGSVWEATGAGIRVTGADGAERMITGADGLPYEDVTAIVFGPGGEAWAGTPRGAMFYDGGRWLYFAGRRWLPDDAVNDIAFADDGGAWVATDAGVGRIARRGMTLEQKAAIIDRVAQERHNRDGFVTDSALRVPGDTSSFYLTDDDNDGQWTQMYLASQCFRYAATGDPAALDNARRSMEAMLRLLTISPVKGFPARSILPIEDCPGMNPEKWRTHPGGEVCWKGDTSVDEVVGHMFGFPIYYDLCATPDEKRRISEAVAAMIDRIVDSGYRMLDENGEVTSDGHWEPEWINHGTGRFGDQGLNSIEILNALISAHHITGDDKYLDHYYTLLKEHGYHRNVRKWKKISDQHQINYDSYEMGLLSFYNLLRYEKDEKLWLDYYFEGLRRAHGEMLFLRDAEEIIIYGVFAKRDYGLESAVETLRELPVDLVMHTVENSHRADIREAEKPDRFGKPQNSYMLPFTEVFTLAWSKSLLRLDDHSGSMAERDGTFWLLPYWMARYHCIIKN